VPLTPVGFFSISVPFWLGCCIFFFFSVFDLLFFYFAVSVLSQGHHPFYPFEPFFWTIRTLVYLTTGFPFSLYLVWSLSIFFFFFFFLLCLLGVVFMWETWAVWLRKRDEIPTPPTPPIFSLVCFLLLIAPFFTYFRLDRIGMSSIVFFHKSLLPPLLLGFFLPLNSSSSSTLLFESAFSFIHPHQPLFPPFCWFTTNHDASLLNLLAQRLHWYPKPKSKCGEYFPSDLRLVGCPVPPPSSFYSLH